MRLVDCDLDRCGIWSLLRGTGFSFEWELRLVEGDIPAEDDSGCRWVPETVGIFGVWFVSKEDAFDCFAVQLVPVRAINVSIGGTAENSQVFKIWRLRGPDFLRGVWFGVFVDGSVADVRGSCSSFCPEFGGKTSTSHHGSAEFHDSAVQAFCFSILLWRIGSRVLMDDPIG